MCTTRKARKKVELPPRTQVEIAKQAAYEEFWSDPCWSEPLEEETKIRMEIAAQQSKL